MSGVLPGPNGGSTTPPPTIPSTRIEKRASSVELNRRLSNVEISARVSSQGLYDDNGRPFTTVLRADVDQQALVQTATIVKRVSNVSETGAAAPADAHTRPLTSEEAEDLVQNFIASDGLTTEAAQELLKRFGRNELEEKNKPKWLIFLEQLWQPMPLMIWAAIIIEGAIESWPDMGILLGIQILNASLSYYETTKAGDAVAALKASLKPMAHAKRDGKFVTIEAAELVPGDLVLLGSGSAVPADCIINHGDIDVDESALTGESLPVSMFQGSSAKMGSNVVRGETEATVQATGKNTFFGKTASLLNTGANEVSNLQKLLITIMLVLVACSLTLSIIAFIYLLLEGENVKSALSFTVVLLVASIPVAIEIVCTTTLALGSRQLSKDGAIVSRLAATEDMAGMDMLCSDKTGTLTLNKMVIQEKTPIYVQGESQYSLLRYAAMAARWKEPPRDALDTLVLTTVDLQSLDDVTQTDYLPFDPTIKRTEGTVKLKSGETFKTTKGAPHIILKLIDDKAIVERVEKDVQELGLRGIRALAVAKTDAAGKWRLMGLLTFLDPPRPNTKATIDTAQEFGVAVKMITGDHLLVAKETARQLGMGQTIFDSEKLPMLDKETQKPPDNLKDYLPYVEKVNGFAQVFPEHKFLIVEVLRRGGYKTGMTGDGVNDAPALKRADVGVAVQGATDAARAAADTVLTKPGLSTIVKSIVVARTVFGRMKNFITYRIAATLQLLVFFFIAVLALHPEDFMNKNGKLDGSKDTEDWPRFFHMPVLMLMLITLLNDGTLISIGYDRVVPSVMPEKWNLRVLFTVAAALGGVACLSSLLMLWVSLDSWNPDGFWRVNLGLPGLSYGQITTMVYLKVSISDFLTLFSARSHNGFFWNNPPSTILLVAAGLACSLSTILANVWPESYPDNIYTIGLARRDPTLLSLYVWIYCIICWLIQDAAKVLTYWVLRRYNVYGINSVRDTVRLTEGAARKSVRNSV